MNTEQIKIVGVIGAGQMGSGIAQVAAAAGVRTLLWDSMVGASEKARERSKESLAKLLERGKIEQVSFDNYEKNLTIAKDLLDLAECDLIIEAIVENQAIKAECFKKIAPKLSPKGILASNTSSISITKLAATTFRPDRFIGIHFMNPVPVMKLVEIINGIQTDPVVTATAIKFCEEKLGKLTVVANDSPGFIVNRILVPMINEAIYLLQEGVRAEDIDKAMTLGTNQPMGPLTLADFVGLDTLLYILEILHRELGEDKYRPCPLLRNYVAAGWFGKKTGRGFYRY
ncbi:MAG TPA: 3-hydroxyacyl-CoA dehydrogenase NAD-binding domain-containing protein [Oligoflexia bacterium]|nr:3-hydroxyacyl-CoA dehydrogenase NAD-binding domain-containing protein [Oligoflexia bacterium]HMP27641.1 3-hydroxyacyl-CoA dehydrogenase NAD-binding domain-containing protein [Oligoflexia bacterium]